MKKAVAVIASLIAISAFAAEEKINPVKSADEQQQSRSCIYEGKIYSRGARIIDQTKTVLLCEEQRGLGSDDFNGHRIVRPLIWWVENDYKRLLEFGRQGTSSK